MIAPTHGACTRMLKDVIIMEIGRDGEIWRGASRFSAVVTCCAMGDDELRDSLSWNGRIPV
jgi:hypothetical protein